MDSQIFTYLVIVVGVLFALVVIAYVLLRKNDKERKYIEQLQEGTKTSKFDTQVVFQKLYMFYLKTPFLKRYVLKLRRRLEIVNIDDEYLKTVAVEAPKYLLTIMVQIIEAFFSVKCCL